MMPKAKGTYSMLVTDVQHGYKMRGTNYIHLVTFQDPSGATYVAENMEADPESKFVKGKVNIFELTNPGKPGYLDWVRFTSIDQPQVAKPGRDELILAQTSFNAALQLGLRHRWSSERIVDEATKFAGNIKLLAKQIMEDMV